ncbi:CoA binding domain-containing protein [Mycena olivaceomarginata]|nr:CoA binding domain-containing protein [Mycena olivaceomarginata]
MATKIAARFLSASKFAVVGASTNPAKNGSKAFKFLLSQHKEVVPINPNALEIQGIKCLKTLSQLPDPTHTSVSIVVKPQVTLEVLKLAKSLNVYALWLQPGAEDDAVVEFIESDAQLKARCVYREHALHTTTASPMIMSAATAPPDNLKEDCIFFAEPTATEPTVAAADTLPAAASLAALNTIAGITNGTDLGEEIPGLA